MHSVHNREERKRKGFALVVCESRDVVVVVVVRCCALLQVHVCVVGRVRCVQVPLLQQMDLREVPNGGSVRCSLLRMCKGRSRTGSIPVRLMCVDLTGELKQADEDNGRQQYE